VKRQYRLGDLVERFGGSLEGDAGLRVSGFATLEAATPDRLAFLSNTKYRARLGTTRAGAVMVRSADAAWFDATGAARPGAFWLCPDPYLMFARVAQMIAQESNPSVQAGVAAGAMVDASAVVDPSASIAPGVVIEAGVHIGARVRIGAGCAIGRESRIAADTVLFPRVVVYQGCSVGERCIVHAGAVIGSDGFGFARDGAAWIKIPQTGAVVIGNDVEIGANTCIDRGALSDTVIGNGVKLDNQIQVGHNVRIGDHTAVAGCAGIAGSTTIGQRCTVGGAAMVLGHLNIADDVHVSAATVVTHSLRKSGQYTGFYPIAENATWEKTAATLRKLPDMRARLRALEKTISHSGEWCGDQSHVDNNHDEKDHDDQQFREGESKS